MDPSVGTTVLIEVPDNVFEAIIVVVIVEIVVIVIVIVGACCTALNVPTDVR